MTTYNYTIAISTDQLSKLLRYLGDLMNSEAIHPTTCNDLLRKVVDGYTRDANIYRFTFTDREYSLVAGAIGRLEMYEQLESHDLTSTSSFCR
jgi:hypothetical protein